MIVFAAIMPHPPESIPGIGKEKDFEAIKKTLDSFEQLRLGLEQVDPETIVIISPHAYMEQYSFVINTANKLTGSLMKFGLDEIRSFTNDTEIVDKLAFACSVSTSVDDMPTSLSSEFLDYGALIPLYHLTKNIKPKIVHLSFSLMDYKFHYRYGEIISKVVNENGGRIAIVASADLSHRLTMNAPAGFSPKAKKFDRDVIHFLGSDDITSIINFDQEVIAEVAECGMRSIIILLGILHGTPYKFELLNYESPLGIGYLTARLV